MRSELVFGAMTYVSNRLLLTRVTAKATRKFHRPNTRIQDTANEVFERFRLANPLAVVSCIGNLQPFGMHSAKWIMFSVKTTRPGSTSWGAKP